MRWNLTDTGPNTAVQNMAIDTNLLEALAKGNLTDPTLHLYDWEGPSATFGYFIDPNTLLKEEGIKAFGLQLARRPTGGGIIFHVTDFAFSILVPAAHPAYSLNTLENYAFVNNLVKDVLKKFLGKNEGAFLLPNDPPPEVSEARYFCMAKPTIYDVMLNDRKVGGGAQRRTKHGFLHQGSISLAFPDEAVMQSLLSAEVLGAMRSNTFALLPGKPSSQDISQARQHLRQLFKTTLEL